MREWSVLTDAFLDTITDVSMSGTLDEAWQDFIRREEICECRDAYAVSRGVPSLYE